MRIIIRTAPDSDSISSVAEQIARCGMPEGADIIYDERNRLFRIRHDGEPYIVKAFRRPNFINSLAYVSIRKSKARRSFENALRLAGLGFDTPEAAAYMEVRRGGRLAESYYISRDVHSPQIRFWDRRQDAVALADALAAEMVRLHAEGVWHKDFSPGNILVENGSHGGYRLYHIDLNRMQFGVTDLNKLLDMFGRLHDDEAPVLDLARRYGKRLERLRQDDIRLPKHLAALTTKEVESAAHQSYIRFWSKHTRKKRIKSYLRRLLHK